MKLIVINRAPTTSLLSCTALKRLSARLSDTNMKAFQPAVRRGPIRLDGGEIISRDNPHLIATIKELGRLANGPGADLEIVAIPDAVDWSIKDVCGIEFICADGKMWPNSEKDGRSI